MNVSTRENLKFFQNSQTSTPKTEITKERKNNWEIIIPLAHSTEKELYLSLKTNTCLLEKTASLEKNTLQLDYIEIFVFRRAETRNVEICGRFVFPSEGEGNFIIVSLYLVIDYR